MTLTQTRTRLSEVATWLSFGLIRERLHAVEDRLWIDRYLAIHNKHSG